MVNFRAYIPASIGIFFLLAEGLFISLLVDAKQFDGSLLTSYMGYVLRWMLASGTLFSILLFTLHRQDFRQVFQVKPAHFKFWLFHLASYILLVCLTYFLFKGVINHFLWLALWYLLILSTLLSWFRSLYDFEFLLTLIKAKYQTLLISAAFGVLLLVAVQLLFHLWKPLTALTLNSSAFLLKTIFPNQVFVDIPKALLGLNDFVVLIAATCSGIEGLAISQFITAFFLFGIRHQLRFPMAFLLFPLAGLLAIVFNIFRITLLIIIGAFISPDLAVEGFHSVAGWISAIIIAFLIIFVFSSLDIFYREQTSEPAQQSYPLAQDAHQASVTLIPFIVVLAVTLFNGMFNEGFDYLYPLKVILSGTVLFYFWKDYEFKLPDNLKLSIPMGLLVAFLWILFVPSDEEYNALFIASFYNMGTIEQLGWALFRTMGFLIIAPLTEELVFRGYLLARLAKQNLDLSKPPLFSPLAIVVSSALFGLIHGAWFAGVLAGVLFAIVRYRSTRFSDTVLCHFIANLAVGLWAFSFNQWWLL